MLIVVFFYKIKNKLMYYNHGDILFIIGLFPPEKLSKDELEIFSTEERMHQLQK